jgi:hypothetical protein
VVVTGANANEGQQAAAVLGSMVIRPPAPDTPNPPPDVRDLPRVRADGGYGNRPTRERAAGAGHRVVAPSQGQSRRGFGRVRCAVERGHALLSQFGRVARRFDRDDRRYLGWVQLASAVIFIRHEANSCFR